MNTFLMPLATKCFPQNSSADNWKSECETIRLAINYWFLHQRNESASNLSIRCILGGTGIYWNVVELLGTVPCHSKVGGEVKLSILDPLCWQPEEVALADKDLQARSTETHSKSYTEIYSCNRQGKKHGKKIAVGNRQQFCIKPVCRTTFGILPNIFQGSIHQRGWVSACMSAFGSVLGIPVQLHRFDLLLCRLSMHRQGKPILQGHGCMFKYLKFVSEIVWRSQCMKHTDGRFSKKGPGAVETDLLLAAYLMRYAVFPLKGLPTSDNRYTVA